MIEKSIVTIISEDGAIISQGSLVDENGNRRMVSPAEQHQSFVQLEPFIPGLTFENVNQNSFMALFEYQAILAAAGVISITNSLGICITFPENLSSNQLNVMGELVKEIPGNVMIYEGSIEMLEAYKNSTKMGGDEDYPIKQIGTGIGTINEGIKFMSEKGKIR